MLKCHTCLHLNIFEQNCNLGAWFLCLGSFVFCQFYEWKRTFVTSRLLSLKTQLLKLELSTELPPFSLVSSLEKIIANIKMSELLPLKEYALTCEVFIMVDSSTVSYMFDESICHFWGAVSILSFYSIFDGKFCRQTM